MHALIFVATLLVAPPYQHVGGAHGVDVFRQMASSNIDLAAEGDIDAPPDQVRAVILDYANANRVTDHVAESRVLSSGERQLTVYQRLKLPVVSDRDFNLRTQWGERGQTLWVRFAVDNSHGQSPRKGIVRLSTLNGSWDLVPIRGGHATHAVYHVQIDLAGSVPRWMVSGGAAKDLPKLFEGLRHELQRRSATARND